MKNILSIVIPVYNVEKYIGRCLDSILCQDLTNCEIIVVDDGSTDSSGDICDKYATLCNTIKVYHKENGGLSDARNYGIDKTEGDYIWFIDSDDFIDDGCIQKFIEIIKNEECDVIVCQSKTVDDNNLVNDECKYSIPKGVYTSNEYMKLLKKNPKSVLFCAQYHICRKEFILNKNLYFYKGIIHEDELWTPQLLINAKKICYSNLNIYYHYMRSDSIMHNSKLEKSGKCDLFVATELFNIFDETQRNDLEYLRDRVTNIFLQAVWKYPNFFNENQLKRFVPLKNAYYFKSKIKSLVYFISPKLYLIIHKHIKNRGV